MAIFDNQLFVRTLCYMRPNTFGEIRQFALSQKKLNCYVNKKMFHHNLFSFLYQYNMFKFGKKIHDLISPENMNSNLRSCKVSYCTHKKGPSF